MRYVSGKIEKKLRRMFFGGDGHLTIGLAGEARIETGEDEPGSYRVAMTCNNVVIMMSPAEARIVAERYETEEAKKCGVYWIAQTLREVADEIDGKIRQQHH